ncbi:MAG: ribonuclease R, partial [Acidobacteriota bacterium]|nr:ribonuclease R [Acidobacteriota bacterium]
MADHKPHGPRPTEVGVIRRVGKDLRVRTTDKPLRSYRYSATHAKGRAPRSGDLVLFRPPEAGRRGKAQIAEVLGPPEAPGVDLRVVMARYRYVDRFPATVRRQQENLPRRIRPRDREDRVRFDDPAPVTIDGETAKDFDDAIAVEPLRGGGFRLYVHIADVAHFVQPDDDIDLEAQHRGTSVYFPGKVVPMLPETISNDLCSLRPNVERLVQSVIIDFDSRGKRKRVKFADGVIRSAGRLTYRQVSQVLAGGSKKDAGVPKKVVPMLKAADALRERLELQRQRRGSLDFDLPEPIVLLDVDGAVTGMTIEPRNSAHRMIEEFMIAANEAVADHFIRHGRHALFRIHEAPEEDRVARLRETVQSFGLKDVHLPP